MSTRSRRGARTKRTQAGVAYVEVLIATPVFVALFGAAVLLGRQYDARILAGQRARSGALSDASAGCREREGEAFERARALVQPPRHVSDNVDHRLRHVPATLLRQVEQKRAQFASDHLVALAHGRALSFETVTQFACNEVPDESLGVRSLGAHARDLALDALAGE